MKKKLLMLMLCIFATWAVWAQDAPPSGTQAIYLKVQPNEEFKFGLIARPDAQQAWIELEDNVFVPLTVDDSPTVPTTYTHKSARGFVKIYGTFHIFGCPDNGNVISELDIAGYSHLEQLYCNNNAITKLNLNGCNKLTLLSCSSNPLDTLDVTGCKELKDLACFNNGLKGIDLSQNKHLLKLQCPQNEISQLNLTANEELQEVYAGKNLLSAISLPGNNAIQLLYAYENELTDIDLSSLKELKDLDVCDNRLTSLNLGNCTKLETIDCSENDIEKLNVTASKDALNSLSCSDNKITQLNIAHCKELNYVNASSNQIDTLALDGLGKLEQLYLYFNKIVDLEAEDCMLLSSLMINGNKMTACSLNALFNSLPSPAVKGNLLIAGNPGAVTSATTIATLKNWKTDVQGDGTGCNSDTIDAPPAGTPAIKLSTKAGSSIVVTMRVYEPNSYVWIETTPGIYRKELISHDYDNPSEFTIYCPGNTVTLYSNVADFSCSKNGNAITAIDASNNPELGTLYCHENAITDINVSGCPYLMDLSCGKNKIKKLDLTGINYIQYLFCYENQLNELDIAHCKLIEELECSSNNIATLDLSHLSRATTIMCHTNQIKKLDLTNCQKLQEFSCANNKLQELMLDSCKNLTGFSCGSNRLNKLDVTKCEKLNRLFCSVNPNLKEIALASNSALQQFSALECALEQLSIPQSPSLIKVQLSKNPLMALDLNECNKLNHLAVDQCRLSVCDMNQLFENMPNVISGELKITGNPQVETAKTEIVTIKGWTTDVQGDGSGCTTGIASANNNEIVVFTHHQTIEVMTPEKAQVLVCDLAGNTVANVVTTPHQIFGIRVAPNKAYIVSINGQARKVMVK